MRVRFVRDATTNKLHAHIYTEDEARAADLHFARRAHIADAVQRANLGPLSNADLKELEIMVLGEIEMRREPPGPVSDDDFLPDDFLPW
jgi:hypothetical protein